MRSAIAGMIGGVGGGATVLTVLVLLGERGAPADSTERPMESDMAFSAADSSPVPVHGHKPIVDVIPARTNPDVFQGGHTAELASEPADAAWTMPEALTDAIATQDWPASVRPTHEHDAPCAAATRATEAPEPEQPSISPSADAVASQIPPPKVDPPHAPTIERALEGGTPLPPPIPAIEAGETDSQGMKPPEPLIAAVTLPEPGVTTQSRDSAPTRSAASEPEELRALRAFRLHVPKELPKVDLAFATDPEATTVQLTDRATGTPTAAPASRTRAIASPSATRAAVTPSHGPSAVSPAPTAQEAAAASGKESLKRASDAVKRLSRRMGGGYVR